MIHPTAVVETGAELGTNVSIGAMAYVGPNVVLGDDVVIKPQAHVTGHTTIGKNCKIYPFTVIGIEPQDLKYQGGDTRVEIGDNNTIREHTQIHAGVEQFGGVTKIGDNNLIMGNVHIAHDVIVKNNTIIVNAANLSGHVVVEDFAILGGACGIHQFVRIGQHAMIGGMAAVERDVVPFSLVQGERSKVVGLNVVGLKRRGFEREELGNLKEAMQAIFGGDDTLAARMQALAEAKGDSAVVKDLLSFVEGAAKRGLTPASDGARF